MENVVSLSWNNDSVDAAISNLKYYSYDATSNIWLRYFDTGILITIFEDA